MKLTKQFARSATQSPGQRRGVEGRLSNRIDEYFADSSRRDGRGRKSWHLCKAKRTLRHLNHATAWQCWSDLDPNVQREAKALVRTACHGQMLFGELMDRASRLRGRVNKAGHVRNARQPINDCEPLREELPQGFSVERLHTVALLAHAGRDLGNCAKNNAYGMHDRLRDRESDFYLVRRGDDPVAMFEVVLETDKITEFRGKENDDVELPRRVLIVLMRRLELNGDDVEACLQQGAASIFATGSGDMRDPDWQRGNLKVWRGSRRLVIREGGKRREWSSFEWSRANWVASHASSRPHLDALMTRHPAIAVLAQRAVRRRVVRRRTAR